MALRAFVGEEPRNNPDRFPTPALPRLPYTRSRVFARFTSAPTSRPPPPRSSRRPYLAARARTHADTVFPEDFSNDILRAPRRGRLRRSPRALAIRDKAQTLFRIHTCDPVHARSLTKRNFTPGDVKSVKFVCLFFFFFTTFLTFPESSERSRAHLECTDRTDFETCF